MPRNDGDFLKDLRTEILATQQRRLTFVLAKMAFVAIDLETKQ